MKGHRSRQQVPSSNPRGSPSHHGRSTSGRSLPSSRYLGKSFHVVGDGVSTLGRSRSASSLRITAEEEKIRIAAKGKTKLIVILGITLPVIACILGIVAWAVTTDILRITPRNIADHDTSLKQFENQDRSRPKKKAMDGLQPRLDPELTVFQFHETTKKAHQPVLTSMNTTMKAHTVRPMTTRNKSVMEHKITTTRPMTASSKPTENIASTTVDIFSKLLSTRVANKTPEFVVFAPILDEPRISDESKLQANKKQNSLKTIIDSHLDLIAEESVVNREFAQGFSIKPNVSTRHRSRLQARRIKNFPMHKISFKPDEKIHNKNQQNSHEIDIRPSQYDFHSNDNIKYDLADDMNEKVFDQYNPVPMTPENNIQINGNSQQTGREKKINPNYLSHIHPNSPELQQSPSTQFRISHPPFPPEPSSQTHQRQQQQQTTISQSYQKSQQSSSPQPYQGPQQSSLQYYKGQRQPPSKEPYQGQQQPPSLQSFQEQQQHAPYLLLQDTPMDSHLNSQSFHTNMKDPQQYQQKNDAPSFSTFPQNFHMKSFSSQQEGPSPYNPINSYQHNFQKEHREGPHPSFQRPPQSFQNNGMHNEEPQYFAPPPQSFHTKTSYGGQPQSSMENFENIAEISLNLNGGSGVHHHRHQHHENLKMAHDQHDAFSDLSNLPLAKDADRLGSLGVSTSSKSPRGITLQIGGGSAGLTGLLPLGALGIAKGILGALLPRPTLGLNGRVFLGLELGKNGGLLG